MRKNNNSNNNTYDYDYDDDDDDDDIHAGLKRPKILLFLRKIHLATLHFKASGLCLESLNQCS